MQSERPIRDRLWLTSPEFRLRPLPIILRVNKITLFANNNRTFGAFEFFVVGDFQFVFIFGNLAGGISARRINGLATLPKMPVLDGQGDLRIISANVSTFDFSGGFVIRGSATEQEQRGN